MLDLDKCWTLHDLVVIDFETCGLLPSDGAVEVACARFESGLLVEVFETLLNPGKPIPESATAIHGIRDEHVAGKPTLIDVADRIAHVCRDAVPCAYSAPFDRGFLHASITGTDCPAFDQAQLWMDPLVIVRKADRFVGGKGRHTLTATAKRWGVELDGAHRAKSDAIATGQLLYRMLERGAVKPCPLGKMLDAIEKMRAEQDADRDAWIAKQPPRESAK